jgi:hypothetical protein
MSAASFLFLIRLQTTSFDFRGLLARRLDSPSAEVDIRRGESSEVASITAAHPKRQKTFIGYSFVK